MTEETGIPIALGLVGVLLIVQNALDLDVRAVVLATIVLTAIWTIFAVVAFREYGANLREVLSRRAWDPVAIRIDDDVSQCTNRSLLSSGDLRDTETALEALADAGSPTVTAHVTQLMSSPDAERGRSLPPSPAAPACWSTRPRRARAAGRRRRTLGRLSVAAALPRTTPRNWTPGSRPWVATRPRRGLRRGGLAVTGSSPRRPYTWSTSRPSPRPPST